MKLLQQPLTKALATALMALSIFSLSGCIVAERDYGHHRGDHERHEEARDHDDDDHRH